MNASRRMLLGLASLACAGLALALPPQDRGPLDEDRIGLLVAQQAVLRVEREQALLEAWQAADEEQRATVQNLLCEGGDARRSSLRPPGLDAISRGLRALQPAGRKPELAPWYELVDAIGLRVTPGVFAAREEGRGEAITVSFERLWPSRFKGEPRQKLQGSLIWISSAGEETLARKEPLSPKSLLRDFEMYIRPPPSAAATWQLVFELRTPQGMVRSFPVRVECVQDLERWRSRLALPAPARTAQEESRAPANKPLRRSLHARLRLLTDHGLRVAGALSLAHGLANIAARGARGARDREGLAAALTAIDGAELGVPGETFWEFSPAQSTSRVLLLLADEREYPTDLLSGPAGEAWRHWARATGTRVIAGHVPLESTQLSALQDLASALQASPPAPRLFVVARGDSGRMLPRLLDGHPVAGLEGFVLSETIAARVPFAEGLNLPTLRVQFEAAPPALGVHELRAAAPRRTLVGLPNPAPLALPAATRAIGNWIESL